MNKKEAELWNKFNKIDEKHVQWEKEEIEKVIKEIKENKK